MKRLQNTKKNLVDVEGYQVVSQETYQRVRCERRTMALCLIGCLIASALYVAAAVTYKWAYVEVTFDNKTTLLELGIWGEYRTDFDIEKKSISSVWIPHFPLPEDRPRLKDQELPHYHRSQASFCVIALSLMVLSIFVGVCSLKHHRYMYKRLTSGVMFITAMSVLVTIQVLIYSIEEWKSFTSTQTDDYGGGTTRGISMHLAWVTFGSYVVGSIAFLIGGRKHKGDRAATQEFEVQDRPMNLSRHSLHKLKII